METYTTKQIYDMLMSQGFADWYEAEFMEFVHGESSKTVEEVQFEIETLL